MNAVKAAIFTRLDNDRQSNAAGSLGSLGVTGIFDGVAPQGQAFPYVVFHKATGRSRYTLPRLAYKEQRYLVKAVDKGKSEKRAGDIDARLEALLSDATFTVTGWTLMVCRRESDADAPPEVVSGETYHHIGGLYTIMVEPDA